MITNKSLITIADLRLYAPVGYNLDGHWINGFIDRVQLQYIIPCIGRPLFDELLLQTNTNTLTALNVNLLDNYLKRVIAWFTYFEGYNSMAIRAENKGVVMNTDDKSTPVTANLLAYLKSDFKNTAETFLSELIYFLNENNVDYPLYPYLNSNCDSNQCNTGSRSWGIGGLTI